MTESRLTLAAKNIRAELRQRYQGTKFSVRSRRYAGGDSISVAWIGGPDAAAIALLTQKYEQGTFNGNTDSYEYTEDPQRLEFHRLRGATKYVMLYRRAA